MFSRGMSDLPHPGQSRNSFCNIGCELEFREWAAECHGVVRIEEGGA